MTNTSLLGIGLYTTSEAARLLRVDPRTLGRWAEGYSQASQIGRRTAYPVIQRDITSLSGESLLTFTDLLELHMVALFRSENVSLQTIRAAADKASRLFNTTHPFVVKQFETDGRHIFATLEEEGVEGRTQQQMIADLTLSQMVISSIARSFFAGLSFKIPSRCAIGRWTGTGGWCLIHNAPLESRLMRVPAFQQPLSTQWREVARRCKVLRIGMKSKSRP